MNQFETYRQKMIAESLQLQAKHKKYISAAQAGLGEGFDSLKRAGLATLLENVEIAALKSRPRLSEATQVADVTTFKRFAFPIITAVYPNLIANELVTVQPLKMKTGQIFFLDAMFGSDKGSIKAGDAMFTAQGVAEKGYTNYAAQEIDQELLPEVSAASANVTGTAAYYPVIPGSVKGTFDKFTFKDDGKGGIVSAVSGTTITGTINYQTGSFTITFPEAVTGTPEIAYSYNNEYAPSHSIPQIDLRVRELTLTAKSRKLRSNYAFDAAYDLEMSQGVTMDNVLLEAASAELKFELDGEILNDLWNQAGLTSTWNNVAPFAITAREHLDSFVIAIHEACKKISGATRRAEGNWVVVGQTGGYILSALGEPRFKSSGQNGVGPYFMGTLDGRIKVYYNPYFGENDYLVGYKGDLFLDAGYVFAPYLPLFATNVIMLDDFIGRRGYATSNGKRMLNPNYYVKGTITNVPVAQP